MSENMRCVSVQNGDSRVDAVHLGTMRWIHQGKEAPGTQFTSAVFVVSQCGTTIKTALPDHVALPGRERRLVSGMTI